MLRIFCLLILTTGSSFAAGSGHASDLIPSFINLGLLLTFLGWKLKQPAKQYFDKKSSNVSEVLERASVKSKEAGMMLQMQQKKIEGMDQEISKIFDDAKLSISKFKETYAQEVDERIKKLKEDASQKIEAEKKQLMDQVNNLLLDEVIAKTKTTIKNNTSINADVTKNILQELR